MLDMVMTNSARVNDIVESVLQVSRREPPNSSVLPVAEWLSGYRQRYLDVRKDAGEVTIEYADPDARIRFDPEHLQRVLDNLVDNAMRTVSRHAGRRARNCGCAWISSGANV
jgi:two-component system sensor histidine kinase PilS (NtrC family)